MSDTYPVLRNFLLNEYFFKGEDAEAPGSISINAPHIRVVHDVRKIPNAESVSHEEGMPDCAEPRHWYAQFRRYCKALEGGDAPATVTTLSPGIVKITSSGDTEILESPLRPLLDTLVDIANTEDGFHVRWADCFVLTFIHNNKGINLFLHRPQEVSGQRKD